MSKLKNKYQEALNYLTLNSSSLLVNQGNKDTELMSWHYESRDLLQELVDKEALKNPILEELGCPLEVVLKALLEGVYYNFNLMLKEEFIEPIDLSLKFSLGGFYCLYFEQWGDGYEIDLRDYGKTWWLKKEVKTK